MEALLLGLDFAFDILKVDKVYMDAAADNHSVRGTQIQIGAKEYRRGFHEGIEYEYVFSVLSRENYQMCRKKIMSLIERHVNRLGGKK